MMEEQIKKLQSAIDNFSKQLEDGTFEKLLKRFPVECDCPRLDFIPRSRWVFVKVSQVHDAVEYLKAHITIIGYENKYRSGN